MFNKTILKTPSKKIIEKRRTWTLAKYFIDRFEHFMVYSVFKNGPIIEIWKFLTLYENRKKMGIQFSDKVGTLGWSTHSPDENVNKIGRDLVIL